MLGSISVKSFRAPFALTTLVIATTIPLSGQANRANQAQMRWYDAYQQGVTAVQRRDWATAERLLSQAQSSGTKPGPRVFTYGDTYIRFIPDYYLGVVYLNTSRDREAEAAFARTRNLNVIGVKDPEYTAFERQGREATFNRAMKEAVDLTAKGDLTQATSRVEEARATKIDNAKVTKLSSDITQQMAKAAQPPAPTDSPTQPPIQQYPSPIQTPTGPLAGNIPNASNTPNASLPKQGVVIPKGTTATLPKPGIITPQPRSTDLRNGLLAFFSGDYGTAIPLLSSAAQQPGATPRAAVFLACAKVGLVLTGGGDAAMLREARAAFQSVDAQRDLSAADRRFISPRVLQQLEAP